MAVTRSQRLTRLALGFSKKSTPELQQMLAVTDRDDLEHAAIVRVLRVRGEAPASTRNLTKAETALAMIVNTPNTYAWLTEMDPKGLEQALAALPPHARPTPEKMAEEPATYSQVTYVARGPNCWGKSTYSPDEAIKNMKENWPSFAAPDAKYLVQRIVGTFHGVDGMGTLNYVGKLTVVKEGTYTPRGR